MYRIIINKNYKKNEELEESEILSEGLRSFIVKHLSKNHTDKLYEKVINNILKNKNVPENYKRKISDNRSKVLNISTEQKKEVILLSVKQVKKYNPKAIEEIEKQIQLNEETSPALNDGDVAGLFVSGIGFTLFSLLLGVISIINHIPGLSAITIITAVFGFALIGLGITSVANNNKKTTYEPEKEWNADECAKHMNIDLYDYCTPYGTYIANYIIRTNSLNALKDKTFLNKASSLYYNYCNKETAEIEGVPYSKLSQQDQQKVENAMYKDIIRMIGSTLKLKFPLDAEGKESVKVQLCPDNV